ncbi:MAG TPA: guanylate kinase [bacterium]|nr:guanylate kinase [bacterium]
MSSEHGGGNIFVITAPSGSGKTTLCRNVIKRLQGAIRYSVSHTTRPPRGKEKDGVDYHFVSDEDFQQMIAADELAEWAAIHGHSYGTSKAEINRAYTEHVDLFLDIEGQGALQIKRLYPEAVMIFILPPNWESLRQRLTERNTDSPEEIERRLANAQRELQFTEYYDYVVVNDDMQLAIQSLEAIIRAHRNRRENQLDAIRRLSPA